MFKKCYVNSGFTYIDNFHQFIFDSRYLVTVWHKKRRRQTQNSVMIGGHWIAKMSLYFVYCVNIFVFVELTTYRICSLVSWLLNFCHASRVTLFEAQIPFREGQKCGPWAIRMICLMTSRWFWKQVSRWIRLRQRGACGAGFVVGGWHRGPTLWITWRVLAVRTAEWLAASWGQCSELELHPATFDIFCCAEATELWFQNTLILFQTHLTELFPWSGSGMTWFKKKRQEWLVAKTLHSIQ